MPVHLHRELLDINLAPYLDRYTRYLRRLHKRGTRWFARNIKAQDHYAKLRISGDHLHVMLLGRGGVLYEFFTPDHVADSTLASPGHGAIGDLAHNYVCGSATRGRFGVGEASLKPLSSSTLTGSWPSRDCESNDQRTLGFYTYRSWQNQKFFEHCWHPNNDGKSLVTSCQAQAPGLGGQCNWMSPYTYRRLASAGSIVSDFGLDLIPCLYEGESMLSGGPVLDQDWIWYRRAAVHSASGKRFFVHTDNYGRFQVYPVKNYDSVNGLVPIGQYKQYTPPYPGWVTAPTPGDFRNQINDWLWRFNKDATKCVAIAYHSDFPAGFSKLMTGLTYFATLIDSMKGSVHPSYVNAIVPAREDTPGLIEFGIKITLTGDGDMDFNVEFTVLRTEYFGDNQRFFFDAAYFMKDVERKVDDPNYIAEDTLMTAEVECKYPAGQYLAATPDGWFLDQAGGVQGEIVINANDNLLQPTKEWLRFPTFGGHGRFATPLGYKNAPGGTGSIGNNIPNTSGGTTFIASAGPCEYTPPNPPFPPKAPDGTPWGDQFGVLQALELSTLSVTYQVQDQVAGIYDEYILAYGKEVFRETGPLGYSHAATPWPAADIKMPSVRWYQYCLDASINTEWGQGFSVHPHGHWAHSVCAEMGGSQLLGSGTNWAPQMDIISIKEKDGTRSRYRHKDMFNGAFGQNRGYEFYTEPYPGKQLWDQGSFRTAGIFVTFRE